MILVIHSNSQATPHHTMQHSQQFTMQMYKKEFYHQVYSTKTFKRK